MLRPPIPLGARPDCSLWVDGTARAAGGLRVYIERMLTDTMPEAARVRIAALAAMSGSDRLDAALELSDSVRALAEAGREARERTQGGSLDEREGRSEPA